jgi:hypothetical protein
LSHAAHQGRWDFFVVKKITQSAPSQASESGLSAEKNPEFTDSHGKYTRGQKT